MSRQFIMEMSREIQPYPTINKMTKLMKNILSLFVCIFLVSCVQTFNNFLSSDEIYQSLRDGGKVGLHIHFKTNSYKLVRKSKKQIAEIAKALEEIDTSDHYVLVIGHTDQRGDKDVNKVLSLNRAAEVVNWLIDNHRFPPDKIRWEGKGEAELLISPERTAHDRFMNRRVEVVLIKK